MLDQVQKLSNPDYNTPSSEPFTIDLQKVILAVVVHHRTYEWSSGKVE
jgi:hypothetical protein